MAFSVPHGGAIAGYPSASRNFLNPAKRYFIASGDFADSPAFTLSPVRRYSTTADTACGREIRKRRHPSRALTNDRGDCAKLPAASDACQRRNLRRCAFQIVTMADSALSLVDLTAARFRFRSARGSPAMPSRSH